MNKGEKEEEKYRSCVRVGNVVTCYLLVLGFLRVSQHTYSVVV